MWSLSLRFSHRNPVCTPLSHTCYMLRSSHSSRCELPDKIWCRAHTTKLVILYFTPLPCDLIPLGPKYFPQHPISKHSQPTLPPNLVGNYSNNITITQSKKIIMAGHVVRMADYTLHAKSDARTSSKKFTLTT